MLQILVTDEGPGVSAPELERIFEPFLRGDNAVWREGYGLGLAIARQAVEWHGGRVSASIARSGGLAITLVIARTVNTTRPPGPVVT